MSTINTRRSKALYNHLTDRQRIAVLLELIADQDTDEIQRLVQHIPKRTYIQRDAAVFDVVDHVMIQLLAIASDYWRWSFALVAATSDDDIALAEGQRDETVGRLRALADSAGVPVALLVDIAGLPGDAIVEQRHEPDRQTR